MPKKSKIIIDFLVLLWFTLIKLILENSKLNTLFNVYIDCIIYGEGKKAAKLYNIQNYLSLENNFSGNVYYWGDLDYKESFTMLKTI